MSKKKDVKIAYGNIWEMAWHGYRSYWFLFPVFLVFAILSAAFAIIEPVLWGAVVDGLIQAVELDTDIEGGFAIIKHLLIIWVVVVFGSTIVMGVHQYLVWFIGNGTLGLVQTEFFRRMLRRDIQKYENLKAGEVIRRFDAFWDAFWAMNSLINKDVLVSVLTIFGALVVGLIIEPRLLGIALLPIPFLIFIGTVSFKKTTAKQDEMDKRWEGISGYIGDSIANITTVKGFTGEKRSVSYIARMYEKLRGIQNKINYRWAGASSGYEFVKSAGRFLVFLVGAYLVFINTTSVGELAMFLGFSYVILNNVQFVLNVLPDFSRNISRLNRAASVWFDEPAIQDREGAKKVGRLDGEIVFDDVSFSYESGKAVLRDTTFTIPAGKTVALVGESGAGKSTLTKLLVRFYDPIEGNITIDGTDIRDMTLESLRDNIGYVMQENLLFHESILDNIKYGDVKAGEKDVIAAAKRAQAHDFIKELPNGYKTVVGERGVKLSGGQKQRIALARVFLSNPPILVLDEATSALDSRTEHELQEALKEVMKDRTTLVIAHRLSTVLSADNIIVMDNGRVVDQGKHEELIKRGGLYKAYWEIQAGGYV